MGSRDEIVEAVAGLKKLAAKCLVRKEAAEEALKPLQKRLALAEDELNLAVKSDDDDAAMRLLESKRTLEDQVAAAEAERDQAEAECQQALAEIDNLKRSADELDRARAVAQVSAGVSTSDFDMSPEAVALRNVREHMENLEARVSLDQELAGGSDRELRRELKKIEKQNAEERARQELAELKAKLNKGKSDASGERPKKTLGPAEPDDTDASDPQGPQEKKPRPKRTM